MNHFSNHIINFFNAIAIINIFVSQTKYNLYDPKFSFYENATLNNNYLNENNNKKVDMPLSMVKKNYKSILLYHKYKPNSRINQTNNCSQVETSRQVYQVTRFQKPILVSRKDNQEHKQLDYDSGFYTQGLPNSQTMKIK